MLWLAGSSPQRRPPRCDFPDRELRSLVPDHGGQCALDPNRERSARSGISPRGGLHGGPSARGEPEIATLRAAQKSTGQPRFATPLRADALASSLLE